MANQGLLASVGPRVTEEREPKAKKGGMGRQGKWPATKPREEQCLPWRNPNYRGWIHRGQPNFLGKEGAGEASEI